MQSVTIHTPSLHKDEPTHPDCNDRTLTPTKTYQTTQQQHYQSYFIQ